MIIGEKIIGKDLFFIVEEGQFNQGDIHKAFLMIELASKAGADAIEFQLAYAKDLYIKSDPGFDIYKNREFTDQQLSMLIDYTVERKIGFIATCLSQNLVPKLAKLGASAFNLNASDINNTLIIDAILESGIPFFISTPLATEEEIDRVTKKIESKGRVSDHAILHGQHSMATGHGWVSPEETSLGYISTLSREFSRPVGFIDHTPFGWMPAVAVSAGAKIITKHMTPSSIFKGPDWQVCLEAKEMKESIENCRAIYKSILISDKKLAKGEYLDKQVMRRSIVSSKPMKKGEIITHDNITFKRPGHGISPEQLDQLIGSKLLVSISEDTILNFDMVGQ